MSGQVMKNIAVVFALTLAASGQANASGFEKSIMWGGASAGVAGIATPSVTGPEALFFNPAGLVGEKEGQNAISLQVSPFVSRFGGPVSSLTVSEPRGSKATLSYPFGLLYSYALTEDLGFGIGTYVAGGAIADYEGLDLVGSPLKAGAKTDLSVVEVAMGAGYRIDEQWKLGAAYRVAVVRAKLRSLGYGPSTSISNLETSELKDTQFTGFKLGVQYIPDDLLRLGLSLRSPIQFKAKGAISGFSEASGTITEIPSTDVAVLSVFPLAVTLGAQYDLMPGVWKLLAEYAFTQYSKVDTIEIEAPSNSLIDSGGDIQAKWQDQHNLRVGFEYAELAWPIRAGYVWTSRVTNPAFARATFTPPGDAHTLTLGTGQAFSIVDGGDCKVDFAFEYTTSEGQGKGDSSTPPQHLLTPEGTYSASAYSLHAGITYEF